MITLRSKREIRLMRKAGLLVWEAHRRVAELVAPGVTTKQLDDVVEDLFFENDAVPLFKGVAGKVPFPTVTCTSINEQVVHGIPSDRVLVEGDIVSVDTGCRVKGWCGDSAMTYAVGQVSPAVQELLDITKQTLELAIDLLGKRSLWSEVARETEKLVRDSGFSVVEDFVGHGIGRELHEFPQAPNFISEKLLNEGDFELCPGLVLAIEPMVNMGCKDVKCLSDHWTQVTTDKSFSAHYEHTIALTESGPIRLTAGPGTEADKVLGLDSVQVSN